MWLRHKVWSNPMMSVPKRAPSTVAATDQRAATGGPFAPAAVPRHTFQESIADAPAPGALDSYSVTAIGDITDRSLHAAIARFSGGLSPAALAQAYWDWATHLAQAPGKRMQLADKTVRKAIRFGDYIYRYLVEGESAEPCIEPLPQDHRFRSDAWRQWPFNAIYQALLLQQQWWHNATTGLRGGCPNIMRKW
jgi:polyhydroxyalkanoate synthase